MVVPAPEPRRVIALCINRCLFTTNVPGESITTWPDGQRLSCAWIRVESSRPLGERVAQTVVRLGMPPLDINPGFQANVRSVGIICPNARCGGQKRGKKIRVAAPSSPDATN